MREAIGATWIMGIVAAFIALFSAFLAYSVNYSKAYKVKDGIVDRLEKHNGPNQEAIEDIEALMQDIGYSSTGVCHVFFDDESLEYIGVTGRYVTPHPVGDDKYNYCIQKIKSNSPYGQLASSYYGVYVFFSFSLPIFDNPKLFNVAGETVNIYFPDEGPNWFY